MVSPTTNPAADPAAAAALTTAAGKPPEADRRPVGGEGARWSAHALMVPCVVLIGVLVFYPMGVSIFQSLHTDTPLDMGNPFVGLRNYRFVVQDPDFRQAVANTGQYLIFATVGSLVIGLVMALWLHSLRRGRGAALALIVMPWAVPGTVVGVLWSFILNPTETGLLNAFLLRIHVISAPVVWLAQPLTGIVLITLTLVWQTVPIAALIIFAALESIPVQLSEAARVDGANHLGEFWRITLPLLRPALAIALLNTGVTAIGIYDQIYVLSGFSPQTLSVVGKIYTYSFRDFNFGYGIAASVFVTLATAALSLFYLKVVYREIDYV